MTMRKPRFDPARDLVAWWNPRESDLMFQFPRRADGHMLHGFFSYAKDRPDERVFLEELKARGYDVTTIRFSVSLKEVPRAPHVTAVEVCPHGCVGWCSVCAARPAIREGEKP